MTRHIQMEIVEAALDVAFNLEIIGMSGRKAYTANKYLERAHEAIHCKNQNIPFSLDNFITTLLIHKKTCLGRILLKKPMKYRSR